MSGNTEWSHQENAYCLIRIIEWRKANPDQKEKIVSESLETSFFSSRNEDSLKQHFDYLSQLISGDGSKAVDKDKYLVGLYQ